MKFSLCPEMMFPGLDFESKLPFITSEYLPMVEIWTLRDRDPHRLFQAASARGLAFLNLVSSGNLPLYSTDRDGILKALERDVAQSEILGNRLITLLMEPLDGRGHAITSKEYGLALSDKLERARMNLEAAAQHFRNSGIIFVLEPLNSTTNHIGYSLDRCMTALDLVESVHAPAGNIGLLMDVYHLGMMEDDFRFVLERDHKRLVKHVQLGSVPLRSESPYSNLNFYDVCKELQKYAYDGYIGFEIIPESDSHQAMARIREFIEHFSS